MEKYTLIAKTFSGLEEVLAEEVRQLGAENVELLKRGVKFEGNKEILYKANYLLRTALRVIRNIAEFEVSDEDSLYEHVKKINWTDYLYKNQTFVISSDVFHSGITNSQFATLRAKDAIADHYREKKLTRPSVNKDNTDVFVNVHISHDVCTVSLDSSGESLHKRGYKIAADKAPLNEVLAAGMIKLSGWKGETDFYDPMCGSGTIPLEAAMLAMNIPAGYYRDSFAFQKWLDFDEELWRSVKEEADNSFRDIDISIVASDRSEKAVQIAEKNLKHAGLHKDIELKKAYFDELKPESKTGTMIFNPPYGMRLTEKDIIKVYKDIGDVLKKNWAGHRAWIITSEQRAAKFIGLHPSKKIKLYNGPKEAQFLCFEVYEGSKKEKKQYGGKKAYGQDKKRKPFKGKYKR
jgi:putative N6-adenine-specific DNA methylase